MTRSDGFGEVSQASVGELEHEIEIEASVERVWELTADIEGWPDHTPTMASVVRLDSGPITVGSKAELKQPVSRNGCGR